MVESEKFRVWEEDGFKVFEKDYENDLERIYFSRAYLCSIGFPDAEVSLIDKNTNQPVMLGGGGNLTFPYRAFLNTFHLKPSASPVWEVQEDDEPARSKSSAGIYQTFFGRKAPEESVEPSVSEPTESKGVSNRIGDAFSDVSQYFGNLVKPSKPEDAKPEDAKPEDAKPLAQSPDTPDNYTVVEPTEKEPVKVNEPETEREDGKNEIDMSELPATSDRAEQTNVQPIKEKEEKKEYKWILKIPIDSSEIDSDVYQDREILEYRSELRHGIIVRGEIKKIGAREMKLCEEIKEGRGELEMEMEMEGTKGAKLKRLYQLQH